MACDVCGQPSPHYFDVDGTLKGLCCVDLRQQIFEIVGDQCFNTMEVCRILKGVVDPRACVRGHKFGVTRTHRGCCNGDALGCTVHYWTVADKLRQLRRHKQLLTTKCRAHDKVTNGTLKTDLFRFYYIDPEAFHRRVPQTMLEVYTGGLVA